MATKVKCFQDESFIQLTEEVEAFLEKHPNIKIIASNLDYKISHSTLFGRVASEYEGLHCMILIYEEGE